MHAWLSSSCRSMQPVPQVDQQHGHRLERHGCCGRRGARRRGGAALARVRAGVATGSPGPRGIGTRGDLGVRVVGQGVGDARCATCEAARSMQSRLLQRLCLAARAAGSDTRRDVGRLLPPLLCGTSGEIRVSQRELHSLLRASQPEGHWARGSSCSMACTSCAAHEFLEFELRPDGRVSEAMQRAVLAGQLRRSQADVTLRYANNSNYKNDEIITREVFVGKNVINEFKRIVTESEVRKFLTCTGDRITRDIASACSFFAMPCCAWPCGPMAWHGIPPDDPDRRVRCQVVAPL
eukprot:360101-Chlamydomonas_euryale.AAC.9